MMVFMVDKQGNISSKPLNFGVTKRALTGVTTYVDTLDDLDPLFLDAGFVYVSSEKAYYAREGRYNTLKNKLDTKKEQNNEFEVFRRKLLRHDDSAVETILMNLGGEPMSSKNKNIKQILGMTEKAEGKISSKRACFQLFQLQEDVRLGSSILSKGTIIKVAKANKKIILPAGLKRKLNNRIYDLTKEYAPKVKFQEIINLLNDNGIVILQEDNTEWEGFLTGADGRANIRIAFKNSEHTLPNKGLSFYEPIDNSLLVLTWHKITAMYETVAYLS